MELSCARESVWSFFFSLWLHRYTLCHDPIQCKYIQFPKQQLLLLHVVYSSLPLLCSWKSKCWLVPLHLFDYKLVSHGCSWESHELRVVLSQEGDWRSMPASLCLGPCLCVCHSDTWGLLYHRNACAGLTQNLCSSGRAEGTLRRCPSNSWSESPSSRETRLDSAYLLCFDCSQGRANQSEDHHGVGWWRECETKVVFQELDCAQPSTLLGKWGVPEKEEVNQSALVLKWGPDETQGGCLGHPCPCAAPLLWDGDQASVPGLQRLPEDQVQPSQ